MGRTSKKTEAVNIEEQTVGTVQEEQVVQESHVTEQASEQVLNKSEKRKKFLLVWQI